MNKIKTGDFVVVITGKDKGKRGNVSLVKGDRVKVEGLNIQTKHVKPNQQGQKGGIIKQEGSMHISNIMLIAPSTDRRSRIEIASLDDGTKVRKFKTTNELVGS